MVKKQPPHDFDPHPGDPWHPDWIAGEEEPSEEEREKENGWWQRLLGRRDSAGDDAAVPEVYASLEQDPSESLIEQELDEAEKTAAAYVEADADDAESADPQSPPAIAESVSLAAVNITDRAVVEVEVEPVESSQVAPDPPELMAAFEAPEPELPEPESELVAELPESEAELVSELPEAELPEPESELVAELPESEAELVSELPEAELPEPESELVAELPESEAELVSELPEAELPEPELPEPESEVAAELPEAELVAELPEAELPEPELPEPEPESELVAELPEAEPEPVVAVEPDSAIDPAATARPYEDFSDWLIEPQAGRPATAESEETAPQAALSSEAAASDGLFEAVPEEPIQEPAKEAATEAPEAGAAEARVVVPPGPSLDLVWSMERDARAKKVSTAAAASLEPVAANPPEPATVEAQEPPAAEATPSTDMSADPVVIVPPGPSLDLLWSMERAAQASGASAAEPDTASSIASASDDPQPISKELFAAPPPTPAPALPTPEEQEAAFAASLTRILREAAELTVDDGLAAAGAAAHEDARMWAVIADVREELDSRRAAEIREASARTEEPPISREVLAEEARRMEVARAGFDEARLRTEAEVRNVLQHEPGGHPGQALIVEVAETNGGGGRFAAMAAQISEIDRAESERLERREQLNLWTSLLLLDAEQPWDATGWSRPGSSLSNPPSGTDSPQLLLAPQGSITTGSPGAVPESAGRRRWPWSKKQATPTAPSAPQDSLRSVVVIEERSVPDQPNDLEPEGQEAFSLGDQDASPPAADVPSDSDIPADGDIEGELAAWSDLDWNFSEKPDVPADTSPEKDELVEFDQPADPADSVDSADESPGASGGDWEAFTAEEYVQTATHEYADLAAAVAASEAEEPEQAALSADMPGLESNLVSLDDVVEAEGLEKADAHPGRSDLALRVITALALVSLFFASLTYRWSIGLLVLVVMSVAAGELTTALVNRQYHPVALFSYLGTAGALIGAWAYGPVAIPVAVAVTLLVVILFFGLVTGRQDPLVSMALTIAVVLWVGVLGAFAYDLIPAPEYRWLIGSFVVMVALMDVAQYFVGRRFGKRPLAPTVSPKKTVAGLVGGVVAAMAVGYGLSFVAPFDATTGVVLGAALAVTGPTGDLAVSVLKRSMGVKDMGTILPGHGGLVDRIDAILFSLPAAWAVYSWAGLLV